MQPAHDMEFSNCFAVAGSSSFKGLFQRHCVSAGGVFFASEGAQPACGDADIGGINVTIDVEIGLVAVQALAHVVGQPTDGEDVTGSIERKRVIRTEALVGKHLVVNRSETLVVGLK